MHARSALFDVYGDHLRARGEPGAGGRRWSACSTRSGSPRRPCAPRSRGWSCRAGSSRSSSTAAAATAPPSGRTAASTRRPTGSTAAPSRRGTAPGTSSSSTPPDDRSARAPAARRPGASSGTPSWPTTSGSARSPAPSSARARARRRDGRAPRGPSSSTRRPIEAWDLGALRAAYDGWLSTADDLVAEQLTAHDDEDEAAFAARFHLVHEWRKFLFADPGLPDELLPADWPGRPAAELFAGEASRLKPGADRFVARCLDA